MTSVSINVNKEVAEQLKALRRHNESMGGVIERLMRSRELMKLKVK